LTNQQTQEAIKIRITNIYPTNIFIALKFNGLSHLSDQIMKHMAEIDKLELNNNENECYHFLKNCRYHAIR
jgi:hypothetical protein